MEFLLAFTHERNCMITLCIRYTLNPKKLTDFKTYVTAELGPIRRSRGPRLATSCLLISQDRVTKR